MNHSLHGLAVMFGAVPVPGSDVPRQHALDGAGVEIPQYLRGYLKCPQASEVKQSLSCFPYRRVRYLKVSEAVH